MDIKVFITISAFFLMPVTLILWILPGLGVQGVIFLITPLIAMGWGYTYHVVDPIPQYFIAYGFITSFAYFITGIKFIPVIKELCIEIFKLKSVNKKRFLLNLFIMFVFVIFVMYGSLYVGKSGINIINANFPYAREEKTEFIKISQMYTSRVKSGRTNVPVYKMCLSFGNKEEQTCYSLIENEYKQLSQKSHIYPYRMKSGISPGMVR